MTCGKFECLILVAMLCCVSRLVHGLVGTACGRDIDCDATTEFCDKAEVLCACLPGYVQQPDDTCKGPCDGFACSGMSTCSISGSDCECNMGYTPQKTTDGVCTLAPCSGFRCSGMSTCSISGSDCECNMGYTPQITTDGVCTLDPCSGFRCSGMSTCSISGSDCECNMGYTPMITTDGVCTPDPCSGFECIEMSTCAIDGPVCACNQGYLPMITDDGICTKPCAGKPCFGEDPATCMNEGTLCICKGTLIDDGSGNCVDACEGKPCKSAAGVLSCKDANEGVCGCSDFYRLANTGNCVDDCHGKPCLSLGMCRDDLKGDGCYCTGRLIFNNEFNCVSICTGYPCFERDACFENNGACKCKLGQGFDDDGNCIDYCAGKACVADRNCEVNDDTRLCQCREGLKFNDAGTCVDVCSGSECFERKTCAMNGGTCQCSSGLRFDGDKSKCIDIDECTSGTATCSENSGCVNQDGSYACICDPGYDYVNGKCIERSNTSARTNILLGVALVVVTITSIAVCCYLIALRQKQNMLPITGPGKIVYSAPRPGQRPTPRWYPGYGPRFTNVLPSGPPNNMLRL